MMHLTLDDVGELANTYINEEILTDKQLEMKLHMSSCDECYKKFLAACLVQRELIAQKVIPTHMSYELEEYETETNTKQKLKEAEKNLEYMEMDIYDE